MASQSGKKPSPATIPDDLALEILVLLPGKDISRCKCVCKSWRSMIGTPLFRELHRNRHGGQMLYALMKTGYGSVQTCDNKDRVYIFRFHNSPPRRRLGGSAISRPMTELSIRVGFFFQHGIRIVNGLVCVVSGMKSDIQVTVYSVCTGEKMVIPEPLPHATMSYSTFHLGYDPASRTYKLLRLTFPTDKHGYDIKNGGKRRVRAHIMSLRPSSSPSIWRKLSYKAAGIADIYAAKMSVYGLRNAVILENSNGAYYGNGSGYVYQRRRFSGDDGVMIWFHFKCIIIFDLNKEKFRVVKLPPELTTGVKYVVGSRAEFKECGRLVLTLWTETHHPILSPAPDLECFVSEDDEGEKWRKLGCRKPAGLFDFQAGCSVSPDKLQLMVPFFLTRDVCCYSCQVNRMEEFCVGNFRTNANL